MSGRPISEAQRRDMKKVSKTTRLTKQERTAIEAFKKLAETWPPSLTLLVTSKSMSLYIIRTPKAGEDAMEDFGFAEAFEQVRIPVGSCA